MPMLASSSTLYELQTTRMYIRVCQEFCPRGGVHTPLGRHPPDTPPRQTPLDAHTHPVHARPETATAVDDTHPTRMHSCLSK